jgi:hypothetical protein
MTKATDLTLTLTRVEAQKLSKVIRGVGCSGVSCSECALCDVLRKLRVALRAKVPTTP